MIIKIQEAIEAVNILNQEVYNYFESFSMTWPLFDLKTDGDCIIIDIGNHRMWFSEEDERVFDENKNEYEPIESFLRREGQKIIDQISGIKL